MTARIVGMVCLAHMVTIGTLYQSLAMLLPEIRSDLDLSTGQAAFMWATLPLASALAVLPAGWLVDQYGERLIGAVAIMLASAAGAGRFLASDAVSLEIVLALYGAFSATVYVCLPGLIAKNFTGRANSFVQGLSFLAYGMGAIAATVIAVPLSEALGGWQYSSLVFSCVSSVIGVLWYALIPSQSTSEEAQPQPRLADYWALLQQRPVLWMAISYGAFTGGYLGFSGLYPLHLSDNNWGEEAPSLLISTAQLAFLVGAVALPAIADTFFSRVKTLVLCMLTVSVLMTFVWYLGERGKEYFFSSLALLTGMGVLMGSVGIYFALITESMGINERKLGTVVGFVTLASYLGGAVYPWFAGAISESGSMIPGLILAIPGYGLSGVAVLLAFRNRTYI